MLNQKRRVHLMKNVFFLFAIHFAFFLVVDGGVVRAQGHDTGNGGYYIEQNAKKIIVSIQGWIQAGMPGLKGMTPTQRNQTKQLLKRNYNLKMLNPEEAAGDPDFAKFKSVRTCINLKPNIIKCRLDAWPTSLPWQQAILFHEKLALIGLETDQKVGSAVYSQYPFSWQLSDIDLTQYQDDFITNEFDRRRGIEENLGKTFASLYPDTGKQGFPCKTPRFQESNQNELEDTVQKLCLAALARQARVAHESLVWTQTAFDQMIENQNSLTDLAFGYGSKVASLAATTYQSTSTFQILFSQDGNFPLSVGIGLLVAGATHWNPNSYQDFEELRQKNEALINSGALTQYEFQLNELQEWHRHWSWQPRHLASLTECKDTFKQNLGVLLPDAAQRLNTIYQKRCLAIRGIEIAMLGDHSRKVLELAEMLRALKKDSLKMWTPLAINFLSFATQLALMPRYEAKKSTLQFLAVAAAQGTHLWYHEELNQYYDSLIAELKSREQNYRRLLGLNRLLLETYQ